MKPRHAAFASTFAVLCFWSLSAAAGPYDNLAVPQLLGELKFNVEMVGETEKALVENAAILGRNRQETEALAAELPQLDTRDRDHGNRVSQHNGEIATYEAQCTGSELDEGTYNGCLGWHSNLNGQKSQLDNESAEIDRAFGDYNRRLEDLNRRERDRAWAAEQLIRKYDEYSANIQSLQLRLNGLAAVQQLENFAGRNQDCAAIENLEAMHQCMQSLWDGARY